MLDITLDTEYSSLVIVTDLFSLNKKKIMKILTQSGCVVMKFIKLKKVLC